VRKDMTPVREVVVEISRRSENASLVMMEVHQIKQLPRMVIPPLHKSQDRMNAWDLRHGHGHRHRHRNHIDQHTPPAIIIHVCLFPRKVLFLPPSLPSPPEKKRKPHFPRFPSPLLKPPLNLQHRSISSRRKEDDV